MSTAWWLLVTFVAGGWCGMLVMALMQVAGDRREQSDTGPGALIAGDAIGLPAEHFEGNRRQAS
jgi:hypothetical protein